MKKNEYILITGGLGYIGSHAVVELLNKKKNVVVIDNLSNSKRNVISKIEKITKKKFIFNKIDIRSKSLAKIFLKYKINSVIHFAGLKSVRESEKWIDRYIDNNYFGTLNLINIMKEFNCRKIIFSSSACVYYEKNKLPFKENSKIKPSSNYGLTKYAIELLLKNFFKFDEKKWSIIILRYFNPIGCHSSGLIFENPNKIENIIPNIVKAIKYNKKFSIYGGNYNTPDGTCYRDYIHVVDLVKAHVLALKMLKKEKYEVINIGTGVPYSVKELIYNFSKKLKKKIQFKIVKRRAGDIPVSYACSKKSYKKLRWKPLNNIDIMCKDIIRTI